MNGLGTGIKMHTNRGIVFNDGGSTASPPPGAQPLNYNYIRFYETFYFRFARNWYLGIGYTKGYMANIAFRPNFTFLGSSKNSLMLNTEFRTYIGLSKRRPDHLIGFWYLGQFNEKGTVPYLGLPALCWDMCNRAGRGYIQGSIRGVNFVYLESEYRFPISPYPGILSGVVFVNATSASSDDETRKLFKYVDPASRSWNKDHVQQEDAFQPVH